MGEQAEYILNGDDCQVCGEYIGPGDGFPRTCAGCGGNEWEKPPKQRTNAQRERKRRNRARRSERKRQALNAANVEGWEKLSDYHFRRTEDGHIVNWWPSTGKWSLDGVMQPTKREG